MSSTAQFRPTTAWLPAMVAVLCWLASAGAAGNATDDLVVLSRDSGLVPFNVSLNDNPDPNAVGTPPGTCDSNGGGAAALQNCPCAFAAPNPANGSRGGNFDGGFSYTPDGGFTGVDAFGYRAYSADDNSGGDVCDAGVNEAAVTLVVNATPFVDAPVGNVSLLEDGPDTVIDLNNVFDDDDLGLGGPFQDELTFSVTVLSTDNPALIDSISINGSGILRIVYAADQNGSATVQVDATDNRLGLGADVVATGFVNSVSDTFVITVTPVNDPPVLATPVPDQEVDEDAPPLVIDLSGVFSDVDIATNGDVLSLSLGAPSGASNVLQSSVISGTSLTLTFAADQNGTVTLPLVARDTGGAIATDSFDVQVNPINDPPVLVDPIDDFTVQEDAPDTSIDLNTVFEDPDVATGDDVLTFSVAANSNPGLFDSVTVGGAVGGDLVLDYAAEQFGTATITVRATEISGAFVEDSFQVTVEFVDDQPVANDDSATMDEDTGPIVVAVLANDFTEDAPVTIIRAGITQTIDGTDYPESSESPPTTEEDALGDPVTLPNGTVQIDGNQVLYNPKANYNGTDFFTYDIQDANGDTVTGTATITINAVNDAPSGDSLINYNVQEDSSLEIVAPGILINATDPDGDTITTVLQDPPANGTVALEPDGSLIYTPNVNFVGTDQFTYFVSDGTTNNADGVLVVAIEVTEAPPPPAPPPSGVVQFNFGLSDVPLELTQGAEPNVLVLMDDSGSMDWSLLTNEGEGRMTLSTQGLTTAPNEPRSTVFSYLLPLNTNIFGATEDGGRALPSQQAIDADAEFNGNNFGVWRGRNARFNRIYYNPAVQYLPWVGLNPLNSEFGDVSPTAAPLDPMNPVVTIDLTSRVSYNTPNVPAVTGPGAQEVCINNFFFRFCFPPNGKTVTTSNYYIPRYYTTTATGEPAFNDPFTLVEILNDGSTYGGGPNREDCAAADGDPLTCSYAEEIQNFANWFTYYRSREYVTKSSLGRVIADATAIGVGYAAINDPNDRERIRSMNASFRAGNKRILLDQLYGIDSNGGTPLRLALDGAGKHYECRAGDIYGSLLDSNPGDAACPVAAAPAGQCQQNFALLFTDGAWNGGNPGGVGNEDAASGSFDGGIYADALANTLGDVAMRYYERDLQSGLGDLVPTTARDIDGAPVGAFGGDGSVMHQHMTTFAVGFGVDGLLTEADIPGDITGTVAWGDPFSNGRAKIDDLRHAALNGRGAYLSAADSVGLAQSFDDAFDEFSTGEGTASAVAFNSQELLQDTLLFRGIYNTRTDSGDLIAQRLDSNGDLVDPPEWTAAEQLDQINSSSRIIFTFDSRTGSRTGIPFRHSSLNPDQQAELSAAQVQYLRGDRSNERPLGLNFRDRPVDKGLLGDVVHSTPVFIGTPPFLRRDAEAYPTADGARYSQFKQANTSRQGVAYVAANDGFLHAFNGNTGDEIFAYVPDKIINGEPYANPLSQLTSAAYSHKFFNDLSPALNDIYAKGASSNLVAWRTVLVGGLRGGGKGYYALEVTDPSSFATEAGAAGNVYWEFTDADDTTPAGGGTDLAGFPVKDLGYTYTQPTIIMTNAKDGSRQRWAAGFGNGYNSTNGVAKLFVLFIEDGKDGWDQSAGDFVKLDTLFGVPLPGEQNEGLPNGLGTPRFIDLDGNGTADVAYAGDLLGNLFRFDLRDDDPANWSVTRLAVATYPNPSTLIDEQQPITKQPIVIRNPQEDGFIVIVGTGSYITEADGTSTTIQSLYGFFDRFQAGLFSNTGLPLDRTDLIDQQIVNVVSNGDNFRTITTNRVDYSAPTFDRGWVLDLDPPRAAEDTDGNANPDTSGNAPPDPQFPGERAIRNLQLRGGFLFVNTIVPRDANACISSPGGFALAFNPASGGAGGLRTGLSAFDVNNDGLFDENDFVGADGDGDGFGDGTDSDGDGIPDRGSNIVAGKRFEEGVPTDSTFIGNTRYTQTSGGGGLEREETITIKNDRTGRLSWQELE